MNDLIKVRITAFLHEAGVMLLSGVIALFASEQFSALIMEHFGTTVAGSLMILVLNAGVKHMRNLKVMKEYDRLGAGIGENPKPIII